jgi:hypothetical protein
LVVRPFIDGGCPFEIPGYNPKYRKSRHESPPIIASTPTQNPQRGRMKTRNLCLLVILSSLLQLTGIAFFARGFFPYKKVLPGFATQHGPDEYHALGLRAIDPPEKLFDRLVFVVIDALRR